MNQQQLKQFFLDNGWTENCYGKLERTRILTHRVTGVQVERKYRIGFGKNAFRVEVQSVVPATEYSKEEKIWTRVNGCYYSHVQVQPDGSIVVGGTIFKKGEGR